MSNMILYPHQVKALEAVRGRNRMAFYLDMGLGKTFCGSEAAQKLPSPNILIVCQKSKVRDWAEHFRKYYPGTVVEDLTTWSAITWKKADLSRIPETRRALIINYDLIYRREKILDLRDFTLILDESSLIQNQKTTRCKFILRLNPDNVILLSGTPTSGKYENLWSQMCLLGWPISEDVYNSQYVNWKKIEVGGFIHKVVDNDNPYKNVERLKRKMRDHGAVFMKTEEVFDLPDQNVIQISVPTTKEYRRFRRDKLVKVDGREFVGDSLLSFRLYQRELCTAYNPAKVSALQDLLESTQDRVIVFYQFQPELEVIRNLCTELQRPLSVVNGSEKDLSAYEQHADSITAVQYQAGAMGLNLQLSNKIVYFGLTEESQLFEQSKKRIHRIGQNRPCFYYLLVCRDSIEDEEILPLLNIRKEYTDELFSET